MRHIVALYNPATGTHRLSGMVSTGDEPDARVTVPAAAVPSLIQWMAPRAGEVAIVLDVPDTPDQPAPPPRPTLKAV